MEKHITIKKKTPQKGDDGSTVISVRMKNELLNELEDLSIKTNRSRNELINLLLSSAITIVNIEE